MLAVISQGNKQYVVKEGDLIRVDLFDATPGQSVNLEKILLLDDEQGNVAVGTPTVAGAVVQALIMGEGRDPKVVVLKRRRRKRYRRTQGHRQNYIELKIMKIGLGA